MGCFTFQRLLDELNRVSASLVPKLPMSMERSGDGADFT